jgi:SAM-dependent methyltransferase
MNRNTTNLIRKLMDEWLPPVVRDSRLFMYPFFHIWFKGKNIRTYMEFKSLVYTMTDAEFAEVYRTLDCVAKDRLTDLNDQCVRFVLEQLDPEAKTLLDVGCGRGYFLSRVDALGRYETHGCDLLDDVPIQGQYHRGSVESLPFADRQFDIVTCHHTLEHIRYLDRAIAELKRVARRQVIIVVPCQRYYYYTLDLHINFFPIESMLINAMKMPQHTCKLLKGDWVFVGQVGAPARLHAPHIALGQRLGSEPLSAPKSPR